MAAKRPTVQRLTERGPSLFTGAKCNREAGTVSDVLICGFVSENGRDYPASVFQRDFKAYEGAVVNCNHSESPTVEKRLGWFSNVAPGPDGRPRGTLNVMKSHPMAESVFEAVERNPALYGFSHVAICETKREGEREIVTAILQVESIDLVATPATTKGLFESKGTTMLTIKTLFEKIKVKCSVKQLFKANRLLEADDGAYPDAPTTMADDADPEPDDAISAGFKAAILSIIEKAMSGSLDAGEALKKVKGLLASHASTTDQPTETEDDDDDDDKPKESKKKKGAGNSADAITESLAVCDAVGLRPTAADLQLLAATPAANRKSLAERLKSIPDGKTTETVKSSAGKTTPGTTVESKDAPPTDAKAFAARYR